MAPAAAGVPDGGAATAEVVPLLLELLLLFALLLLLALELLPELEAVELALVLACGTLAVSMDSSAELVPEQCSSGMGLRPAIGEDAVGMLVLLGTFSCSGEVIASDRSCSRVSSLRTRPLRLEAFELLISGVASSSTLRFMASGCCC